jgi:hypothetical protein
VAYLAGLRFDDLPVHLAAIKEKATAGLQLFWDAAPRAIAVVGGKPLPPAGSWAEIEATVGELARHALSLGAETSALLAVDVREFLAHPTRLATLGWTVSQVEVHRDGALEWLLKGTFERGHFWSKASALTLADAEAVEQAARAHGFPLLSR